ncbi:carbohydrate ABC transporter permease [Clostridium grantii]|uniref:Multiple sugar transport system permease protein n=1 Tax=Clostridium grantii DSM 8605 TaxID=1121316 RepID=A0A1M5VEG5_9CLOT|nr:sugar ABC transporter permease [Clostridium grantii]SHH73514.1 multiple sugar transport system permease protein [Clostridium grantii DSM 8605]
MNSLAKQKYLFIYISLIVPISLLILFVIYPMGELFRISFTNWNGLSLEQTFVGFQNYSTMIFQSPDLWLSLRNNMVYFFTHLSFIPIELALAVMLNSTFFGSKFFKSITFMPYILNGVAVAYAFSYFLSPINGGLNATLTLFGLDSLIHNWLSETAIVNHILASVSLWKFSGYHIILFIAALQSIPKEMLEAATVDGANAFQKFRYIQIPSIKMVVDFVLFTNVVGSLQTFDIPFVMTSGGPGYASYTFTLYTINTAFKYNNFGLAATMAIAMIFLVVIIYGVQSFVIKYVGRDKR